MKYNHEESCECGHHHTHHHEESCQCGHEHHYAEECDEDDCTCCDEDHENLHQPDKYHSALSKYNTALNDDEIAAKTAQLIEKHLKENDTVEVKKFLFHCIDLTTLKCTDSEQSVMKFTERVNEFVDKYPDLDNVAAICVYPNMAEIVNDTLEADNVNIACVSGGFPSSQTFTEIKVAETAMALHAGADEIDIVISVGKFLSGDYEGMCDEIEELKDVCGDKHLKVILETGALASASNIKKASILSMYSGADFIKTSTGKEKPAATPEAAYVMCQAIKEYFLETGRKVGFKPAGGINTVHDALVYYTIVKEVLGKEWLTNELFRLGTSRMANLLLSDIVGQETKFF
ncbi:deoxyribose-phosphate aldolase [Phocaeicola acetigenes]|jgi:deoxyribose-phosphate aldolase|uniref:Deoxyribose-phosphate aldolase n=1 Tax=Phocaeicola acetigenes TaxID=3016083 RepID=A0ABT4PKL4_9BACT|nr:deoxyribose-phosphate aldolase [Phocaeicola sp. KGMB11183]MCZ8373606.1 deoxyribose-phosphate aldolase [Phocaeicola sp. KGMB11183]